MARAAASYRWYARWSLFCRHPGDALLKAQEQREKRAEIRARFAGLVFEAPKDPTRSLYARDRRRSGPSTFDAAVFLGKIFTKLSPLLSRHA